VSDDLDFMPAAPAGASPDKRDDVGDAKAKSTPKSTAVSTALVATADAGPSTGSTLGPSSDRDSDDRAPGERADLPTWNRSRRKRKVNVEAIKQDDAFQRGVRQASRVAIDAPKLVIGAIVITVAVIAGGVAIHSRTIGANAEATRTLQSATAAFVRGDVVPPEQQEQIGEMIRFYRGPLFATEEEREAAIAEGLAAAKASGRAQVERNATLVSAAKAMHAGDFDAALLAYDQFLDSASDDHHLRFLALEGKGNALEAKGELDAALEVFRAIAPRPLDYYRHMALYHQGRVLEGLDRADEALALYEQFYEEFPPSREEMASSLVRERAEALDPDFASRFQARPPAPFPGL